MTKQLFYKNPKQIEFFAKVKKCTKIDNSFHIVLDKTCFYPEGGGQSGDRGIIENLQRTHTIEVIDTQRENKEIIHICDSPIEVGLKVIGKIDQIFRFDLMQQHTGQHLISAIFFREFKIQTKGVHFGAQVSTIDFITERIPDFMLIQAETLANLLVAKSLVIRTGSFSPQDAKKLKLRKMANSYEDKVRVCFIDRYDAVACCGVHFKKTSEIGPIKFLQTEKLADGTTRLSFVAGQRSLTLFNLYHNSCESLKRSLSAPIEKITEELENLKANNQLRVDEMGKRLDSLQNNLSEILQSVENVIIFDQLDSKDFSEIGKRLSVTKNFFLLINQQEESANFIALLRGDGEKERLSQIAYRFGGKNNFYQGKLSESRLGDLQIEEIKRFFQ
ncbi:MAG: alanyl-tRNA editing protein [Spirochaetales bacterium]|nr:alanyl-tRNA editing protein [Spirochaetales bacterium]